MPDRVPVRPASDDHRLLLYFHSSRGRSLRQELEDRAVAGADGTNQETRARAEAEGTGTDEIRMPTCQGELFYYRHTCANEDACIKQQTQETKALVRCAPKDRTTACGDGPRGSLVFETTWSETTEFIETVLSLTWARRCEVK